MTRSGAVSVGLDILHPDRFALSKPSVQAVKGGLTHEIRFTSAYVGDQNYMVFRPNGRLQSQTGQKDQIVGLS